jgi:transposase-like protein
MKTPQTLQEAILCFGDPERTFEYACKLRWPDGHVVCPRCGSGEHYPIVTTIKTKKNEEQKRRLWLCRGCNKQFTLKVNTIFEDSPIGLDKWMIAFWMLVNCKNGVSSVEIHRAIGITQKSAWFMLQRLRLALQEKSFVKLGGPGSEVEVDEAFIGGKARSIRKDRRERMKDSGKEHWGKAVIMGMLERGTVHTKGIENFSSLLKRELNGTYISVEPFRLFRYVDEQAFRFNTRKDESGKKIPYVSGC